MGMAVSTILIILLVLVIVLVLSLAVTLGIAGVGWIVVQVFPALSHFEASLIALVASTALFLVGYRLFTLPEIRLGSWEEDDWDEDEEEFAPNTVPQRRNKPAEQVSPAKAKRHSRTKRR
jgi:hypothetical protein